MEQAQVLQRGQGAQGPQVLGAQHRHLPLVPMDFQAGAGVWQLSKALYCRRRHHSQLQSGRTSAHRVREAASRAGKQSTDGRMLSTSGADILTPQWLCMHKHLHCRPASCQPSTHFLSKVAAKGKRLSALPEPARRSLKTRQQQGL